MIRTLLRNSLILALGLYLSIYVLPEVFHVNETVSKYLMITVAVLWFAKSNNRWLLNMFSIILGVVFLAFGFIAFALLFG
ncbi:hypothetical protein [Priestia aryabhattai]|uniref:hypothetical protein n=1 Tax=Priestia aryabhattai TaxID=412384 RepID=UPI003D2C0A15